MCKKPMELAARIRVASHDLANIVDPSRVGLDRPRDIHSLEGTPGQQEAMRHTGDIFIIPYNLAEIVNSFRNGTYSPREMSGFVKCAVCGGNYIKATCSYRCGTHRNRGEMACTNTRGITVDKLDRAVIAAIRQRMYTPENLRTVIEYVRDELMTMARHEAKPTDQTKALREVEQEIEHIKQAVKFGKATDALLEMLEDADRRRKALIAGQEAPGARTPRRG